MNKRIIGEIAAGTLYRNPARNSVDVVPARRRHVASFSEHLLPPSVRLFARKINHTTSRIARQPMAPGLFGILPLNMAPEVPSAVLVLSIITGLPAALWLYKVE